ncbi:cyclic nucleotide-gated cation channel subunit a [Holotrichia oblita]|uniref:Cyclic nucleotide-gated cation channel subunit a n=1 Tax=Holotrichia oblita TaxID=644536 RepID=A0ACB9SVR0_HOLOL|nr:cyclic nucleotide-gated cation channel subunit a [Holotrichia oblita]
MDEIRSLTVLILITGYFIAQLIKVLQCENVLLMKFETIMEHLKTYYMNLGVHKCQINYMNNYMSMLWRKRNGLQVSHYRYELITELPRTLKIDLMTSIYGKLIKDSYIFCRTERDFIRQLCLQLQHRTYFPGDYIVRDGDVDSCMYFIHKGDVGPGCSKTTGTAFITASPSRILQVQILTDGQNVNETVHEVLHKEEVFGIVQGLFKEIPHHFSFRALTIVDIASLKLNEWEYLLDFFPKSKDIIYQRVEEIYYTI